MTRGKKSSSETVAPATTNRPESKRRRSRRLPAVDPLGPNAFSSPPRSSSFSPAPPRSSPREVGATGEPPRTPRRTPARRRARRRARRARAARRTRPRPARREPPPRKTRRRTRRLPRDCVFVTASAGAAGAATWRRDGATRSRPRRFARAVFVVGRSNVRSRVGFAGIVIDRRASRPRLQADVAELDLSAETGDVAPAQAVPRHFSFGFAGEEKRAVQGHEHLAPRTRVERDRGLGWIEVPRLVPAVGFFEEKPRKRSSSPRVWALLPVPYRRFERDAKRSVATSRSRRRSSRSAAAVPKPAMG